MRLSGRPLLMADLGVHSSYSLYINVVVPRRKCDAVREAKIW